MSAPVAPRKAIGRTESDSLKRLLTEAPVAFRSTTAKREAVLSSAQRVAAITAAFLGNRATSLSELPEGFETRTLRRRCHQAAQCVYSHLLNDARQPGSKPHNRSRELFMELASLLGMSCDDLRAECHQNTSATPEAKAPLDPQLARKNPGAYTEAVRAHIRAQLRPDNPLQG